VFDGTAVEAALPMPVAIAAIRDALLAGLDRGRPRPLRGPRAAQRAAPHAGAPAQRRGAALDGEQTGRVRRIRKLDTYTISPVVDETKAASVPWRHPAIEVKATDGGADRVPGSRPRLFKSVGMAWEDLVLATATYAARSARRSE
jgi:hypothetical protein